MHAKLRIGNTSRRGTRPGFEATHPVTDQRPVPTGVEGAGGICRSAGGRWRGLSGLRGTRPGCGAHGQQEHHRHPYFARNLSRSFFETPQKRCNSNDAHSMFEQAAGELRAKLMGGGGAWPRCRWVAAGPGRASRSTTPSRRLACGDLAGGPPPTGTHSGRAPQSSPAPQTGPPAPGTPAGPQATTREKKPQTPKDLRFHRARGGS